MLKSLQTQMRVIGVVAMREINSQQATLMYGYVWALIDCLLSVLGLVILRVLIRAFSFGNFPPATYVLTGALPWFMFAALFGQTGAAIAKGRRLRAFPMVTELDLVIGVGIQTFITYMVTYVVATTVSSIIENSPFPRLPFNIMVLIVATWLMGISFGYVLLLLSRTYAPMSKLVRFILRFAAFLTGIYIPITRFPTYIWPYLDWNPMLHVEELLRQYWFYGYTSPVGNPVVIIYWVIGLMAFGLICERYMRLRMAPG